jgi:phosphate:Na+ symporter
LLLNIAGGVALLLWATRMVRTGIMRAYGSDLRRFLSRSTRHRLSACLMGVGVAGLMQSSTATALLTVSFAGRGLVEVGPALAIMLGADVGSTLVVQVLSFNVSWFSPVLILLGVLSFLAGTRAQWRHIGRVLIGLGLMLLALILVVGASEPLRDSTTLQYILRPLASDPILAVLLAAVITWLAHSSVAIVLLVMSLALVGVIPVALGFALVLGANVGSGIIPLVLTASGGAMARRIPVGNLLFRGLGAILVLPLIGVVAPYIELLGSDPGRQIANFHTVFNLALAIVFLPLTSVVGAALVKLLPDSEGKGGEVKPRYLDHDVIDTPSVAIACATREVLRMADTVESMLRGVIEVFRTDDGKLLETISAMDDTVDRLHESIKLYLTQVTRNALSDEDSRRCIDLISFTTNLEHIGDIIDKNLLDLAQKKMRNKLTFSEQGWEELTAMHDRALHQMQLAMSVFVSHDIETARQLLKEKERFRELEMQGSQKHLARLRSGRIESIETSALHLDILRDLKRINSHLTSVAYPILDASGELRQSRLKPSSEAKPAGGADKADEAAVRG